MVAMAGVALALALPARPPDSQQVKPGATGLDHIPIAVADLERAAARYRALGFALKPGRPHDNGIRNEHAKFPDGTELELITAPEARDGLTKTYRQHLAAGDGPAFLALYAPDRDRSAPPAPLPGYLFFGPRNASPTDRPEHFAHRNTADSLIEVWLAGDDLSAERKLLQTLGATSARREVHVPDPVVAEVAQLGAESVVLLPGSRQLVAGRPIIGAVVRVKSLSTARQIIGAAGLLPDAPAGRATSSIFLPPTVTHGLWLELRDRR